MEICSGRMNGKNFFLWEHSPDSNKSPCDLKIITVKIIITQWNERERET